MEFIHANLRDNRSSQRFLTERDHLTHLDYFDIKVQNFVYIQSVPFLFPQANISKNLKDIEKCFRQKLHKMVYRGTYFGHVVFHFKIHSIH